MLNRRIVKGNQEVKVPYRLYKDYRKAVDHIDLVMRARDEADGRLVPEIEWGPRPGTVDLRFNLDDIGIEVQFIQDQVVTTWRSKVRADKEIKLHSTSMLLLARFYMHEWYKAAFRHSTIHKWLDTIFIHFTIEDTGDEVVRLVFETQAVADLVMEFYMADQEKSLAH